MLINVYDLLFDGAVDGVDVDDGVGSLLQAWTRWLLLSTSVLFPVRHYLPRCIHLPLDRATGYVHGGRGCTCEDVTLSLQYSERAVPPEGPGI